MTELAWLPTDETPLLEAAVAYASHDFRVVAVWNVRPEPDGRCFCGKRDCRGLGTSAGKHPIGNAWQKRASSNVDAVRDARRGHPNANIGLAMGGAERLVAIDIDGEPGRASLAEIEANVRPWPVTLTSESGRPDGGQHRVMRVPVGLDITRLGNRAKARWPGIDTRTDNGQIVVAPSIHVSGSRYRWKIRAPIAEMPEWLFECLAMPLEQSRPIPPRLSVVPPLPREDGRRAYITKVIENAAQELSAMKEGGRNSMLFAKACTVFEYHVGEGIDHLGAWKALSEGAAASGLKEGEISSVLSKAWRRAQGSVGRRVPERAPSPAASSPTTFSPAPSSTPSPVSSTPPASPPASSEPPPNWQALLTTDTKGQIKDTFGNACKIVRYADPYRGRLTFDQMRVQPMVDGARIKDSNISSFRENIEQTWGLTPSKADMAQAIWLVSEERSFHPVQQYLNGLQWDGTKRIETVAGDILGNRSADALTQRMLRLWFISAVARALKPGCKVDTTLVLFGDQSYRKSSFFEVLGGEWFSNSYVDIKSKDGVLQVHAAWIYEWQEIDRITTHFNAGDVKAFLTTARDDVRPPYAMGIINQPRSSVIVGSTNKLFLDDETGSRRFWPVKVEQRIDVKRLAPLRDQLWAEAVVAFHAAEEWWLTEDEDRRREEAAADFTVENSWLERVARYVSEPARIAYGVTIAEVLTNAFGLELGRIQRGDESKAGKALRQLGWTSRQEPREGTRIRVYRPAAQPHARVVQGCAAETSATSTSSQPAQPEQPIRENSQKREENSHESSEGGVEVVQVVQEADSDRLYFTVDDL